MSLLKGVKNEITVNVVAIFEGDLSKKIKVPFVATYKRLDVSDAKKVMSDVTEGVLSDDDIINSYLVTFSELSDANGDRLEYSTDIVAEMLEHSGYRQALIKGFMQAQFGKEAVKQKN